ncbi:AAA family ATPase [Agromyces sp. SYSU T00194]|uniref:AAA family ATPase n=1 Tax=Agromyces chitinivorans TaxID=3158560 RepID=UPI003394BD3F
MKPYILVSRNTAYDLRMRRLLGTNLRSIPGEFLGIGTSLVLDRVGTSPRIAILGPELRFPETVALTEALIARHPNIGLVIVESEPGDPETWIGRGIHAVVPAQATDAETLDLVNRLDTWLAEYGEDMEAGEFGGVDAVNEPEPEPAAPKRDLPDFDDEVVWVADATEPPPTPQPTSAAVSPDPAASRVPAALPDLVSAPTAVPRPGPTPPPPPPPVRRAPAAASQATPEPPPSTVEPPTRTATLPVQDAGRATTAELAGPADDAPTGVRSEIIVVAAPKGGQGKTTAAINIAVGLAEVVPGEVVLVDADLQFGDIAFALGLPESRTVVGALETRDDDDLVSGLLRHEDDFFVMQAPPTPEDAEHVTPEDLVAVVRRLSGRFRYVVVDTTPGVGPHSLALIAAATDGVFIANINTPSLHAMRKELELLEASDGMPPNRHVVLNFSNRRAGITPAQAAEVVGVPFDIDVPRSPAVLFASNEGVPLIHHDVRDAAAKAFRRLVQRIDPAAVPTRRRIHRRWRAS